MQKLEKKDGGGEKGVYIAGGAGGVEGFEGGLGEGMNPGG